MVELRFQLVDFHIETVNVAFGGKCIVERLSEDLLLGTNKGFGLWFRDAGIAKWKSRSRFPVKRLRRPSRASDNRLR